MQSEIDKTGRDMFLSILQKSSYYKELLGYNNFDKQKSKVSVFHISKRIQDLVDRTKKDKISRILPIIATDEDEKAQFFELLEGNLKDYRVFHIPNPPSDVNFYFHVYVCIINKLGFEGLEEAARNLVQRYNVDEKLELEEILEKGFGDFKRERFKCFKALMVYTLDSEKRDLAKKWLILDDLTEDEIVKLGIESFKESVKSFELIKILSELLDNPILLYFDDVEMSDKERKTLESMKRLHHDINNLIIIMINLRKMWNEISKNADQSFLSILEPEQTFYEFEGVKRFIQIAMEIYWTQNDINPPEDSFFPLSLDLLKMYFRKTRGDIKELLNLCISSIEEIASGDVSLEELLEGVLLH